MGSVSRAERLPQSLFIALIELVEDRLCWQCRMIAEKLIYRVGQAG